MAKPIDICKNCNRGCAAPCAAIDELMAIYELANTKEKRQRIHGLRKLLGIVDAEPAPDIKKLARKIIKKMPELRHISDFNIKVGYVRSFERKTKEGKALYGDCRKVNKIYGAYIPYDFIITIYEPNIGHLSAEQFKILLWHELKHIGVGDRGFIVEPHDVEDFYTIVDSYGTRWGEFGARVADILG